MLFLNNPGNIRNSNEYFIGEIKPSVDPNFKQFGSMIFGYRAVFVILKNYAKHGYNTVAKIIRRYAPAKENDTAAYIDYVSKMRLHVNPDEVIDLNDKEIAIPLVYAISYFENGKAPVLSDIEKGWKLLSLHSEKETGAGLFLLMIIGTTFYYFLIK